MADDLKLDLDNFGSDETLAPLEDPLFNPDDFIDPEPELIEAVLSIVRSKHGVSAAYQFSPYFAV